MNVQIQTEITHLKQGQAAALALLEPRIHELRKTQPSGVPLVPELERLEDLRSYTLEVTEVALVALEAEADEYAQ